MLVTDGNQTGGDLVSEAYRAKEMGVYTIGLTGNAGGELKTLVDLAMTIPSKKTSRIQESHIMIGHILCECVDELLG